MLCGSCLLFQHCVTRVVLRPLGSLNDSHNYSEPDRSETGVRHLARTRQGYQNRIVRPNLHAISSRRSRVTSKSQERTPLHHPYQDEHTQPASPSLPISLFTQALHSEQFRTRQGKKKNEILGKASRPPLTQAICVSRSLGLQGGGACGSAKRDERLRHGTGCTRLICRRRRRRQRRARNRFSARRKV
jgi:hypothetical protein